MSWLEEVQAMAQGAPVDKLESMEQGESVSNIFHYSRPIASYPKMPDSIIDHIRTHGEPSTHIYTKDLQVGGIAVQDDMEKYLSTEDHLSSGTVLSILDTPLHFHYKYVSGWKEELEKHQNEKKHFVLGTFLHQCILEPTKFGRVLSEPKYHIREDGTKHTYRKSTINDLNTLSLWWAKELHKIYGEKMDVLGKFSSLEAQYDTTTIAGARAVYDALVQASGVQSIPEDQHMRVKILEAYTKTYGGGIIPMLVKHSKREISLYATDDETGIKLRVRPDALAFEENIGVNAIISIKSSRAARIDQYCYQACQLDYLMKDAMYLDVASKVTGRDFCTVINVVLQTVEPYGIMIFYYTPEQLEIGKYRYRQALGQIKETMERDFYPGYDAFAPEGDYGMMEFKAPIWYGKELHPISLDN